MKKLRTRQDTVLVPVIMVTAKTTEIDKVKMCIRDRDSTGAVIAKVASTPGAIGYASLDALDDSCLLYTSIFS